MTIYDRIKHLRLKRGISQYELAEKVGYSGRSAISKVENGERDISQSMIQKYADALGVSPSYLLYGDEAEKEKKKKAIRIPVIGQVAAGIPMEAISDAEDWEELDPNVFHNGEYIALRIHGDSMMPRIQEGDVVIVRLQDDAESGDTVIAFVNGDEATCKKLKKTDDGITLISFNPAYDPMFFSNAEIEKLPVRIYGKVVELRGKF